MELAERKFRTGIEILLQSTSYWLQDNIHVNNVDSARGPLDEWPRWDSCRARSGEAVHGGAPREGKEQLTGLDGFSFDPVRSRVRAFLGRERHGPQAAD